MHHSKLYLGFHFQRFQLPNILLHDKKNADFNSKINRFFIDRKLSMNEYIYPIVHIFLDLGTIRREKLSNVCFQCYREVMEFFQLEIFLTNIQ